MQNKGKRGTWLRPFFGELVDYMTSGPILVQVLEGEDAIARNREVMGATDPKQADPGRFCDRCVGKRGPRLRCAGDRRHGDPLFLSGRPLRAQALGARS